MELVHCYRIFIYVPSEALENFIEKVSPQIPSFLGNYDYVCWWSEKGTEQYRHKKGSEIERNPSQRVEIIIPQDDNMLKSFIEDAIMPNHPWEEPVITVSKQEILKK